MKQKNDENKTKCEHQRAQTFIFDIDEYQKLQKVNARILVYNIVVKAIEDDKRDKNLKQKMIVTCHFKYEKLKRDENDDID